MFVYRERVFSVETLLLIRRKIKNFATIIYTPLEPSFRACSPPSARVGMGQSATAYKAFVHQRPLNRSSNAFIHTFTALFLSNELFIAFSVFHFLYLENETFFNFRNSFFILNLHHGSKQK